MTRSVRVVLFTITIAYATGVLVALPVALSLGGSDGFLLALLLPAYISVPTGAVGGLLAARTVRRQNPPSDSAVWPGRGCRAGAILGALGTGTWSVALIFNEYGVLVFFVWLFLAPFGILAGGLVGHVVGRYCNRVSRGA